MGKSYKRNDGLMIDSSVIAIDDEGLSLSELFSTNNAGFHNSIFRGQNLGTSVTTQQQNEISAGTFKNLFIGDYWTINNINWRIAAFNYFLHKGDTECTTPHILLVPDSSLGTAQHQTTNTTTGGYKASLIWTGWFDGATDTGNAIFNSTFGSSHALSHRELISNAVSNGQSSGWEWISVPCGNLLNENMAYGSKVWCSGYDVGNKNSQLPLFALAPDLLAIRASWWLSSVYSAAGFCVVGYNGDAVYYGASSSLAVRPYFVYA